MKRGFIRTLWGHVDNTQRHYRHRSKINNDIKLVPYNKFMPEYFTFVFGEDNYKQLIDSGFKNCELVDKRPIVWDMNKEQFRHKLEALKCGMQVFDELVFTDIDTMTIKPIPDNFWDVLNKKAPIQAILRIYHKRKCFWRKVDTRKTPCAAFIYLRGKETANDLIKTWEDLKKPWSEEVVLMKYMDDLSKGWQGTDYYWEHYEPDFFNLEPNSGYINKKILKTKNICYLHFNHRVVKGLLGQIENNKVKMECFA